MLGSVSNTTGCIRVFFICIWYMESSPILCQDPGDDDQEEATRTIR
jgi:hypothetical protein